MAMSVAGLAFGGFTELAGDFRVAFYVRDLREAKVARIRHRLACERFHQILVGLASFEVRHGSSPDALMASLRRAEYIPDQDPVLRQFVGIDPGREPVPDETTIMRFRHLSETPSARTGRREKPSK